MIARCMKTHLHRPIKFCNFSQPGKLKNVQQSNSNYFNFGIILEKNYFRKIRIILIFYKIHRLQADSHIYRGIFLHVIPVRIIVRRLLKLSKDGGTRKNPFYFSFLYSSAREINVCLKQSWNF